MIQYEDLCSTLNDLFSSAIINPERASLDEAGELSLAVFPRQEHDDGSRTVSVMLTHSLTIPANLKFLIYGVFDSEGDLVGFGRTDRHGAFLAKMQPGEYRIRYLAEAELEVDRVILEAIDDAETRTMLDELDASVSFGQWFADLTRHSDDPLLDFDEQLVTFSEESSGEDWLAEGEYLGLSINRKWFCIEMPFDFIPEKYAAEELFPYGIMQVSYHSNDGKLLGSGLMTVNVDSRQRLVGRIRIEKFVQVDSPRLARFSWEHIGKQDDALIAKLDVEEVKALLESEVVSFNADLRRKIELLITRFNS
ncbi:MAG: hypothetical protein AAF483_16840 [Planctomycetota bacterium]